MRKKILLGILLMFVVLMLTAAACERDPDPPAGPPTPWFSIRDPNDLDQPLPQQGPGDCLWIEHAPYEFHLECPNDGPIG